MFHRVGQFRTVVGQVLHRILVVNVLDLERPAFLIHLHAAARSPGPPVEEDAVAELELAVVGTLRGQLSLYLHTRVVLVDLSYGIHVVDAVVAFTVVVGVVAQFDRGALCALSYHQAGFGTVAAVEAALRIRLPHYA